MIEDEHIIRTIYSAAGPSNAKRGDVEMHRKLACDHEVEQTETAERRCLDYVDRARQFYYSPLTDPERSEIQLAIVIVTQPARNTDGLKTISVRRGILF